MTTHQSSPDQKSQRRRSGKDFTRCDHLPDSDLASTRKEPFATSPRPVHRIPQEAAAPTPHRFGRAGRRHARKQSAKIGPIRGHPRSIRISRRVTRTGMKRCVSSTAFPSRSAPLPSASPRATHLERIALPGVRVERCLDCRGRESARQIADTDLQDAINGTCQLKRPHLNRSHSVPGWSPRRLRRPPVPAGDWRSLRARL